MVKHLFCFHWLITSSLCFAVLSLLSFQCMQSPVPLWCRTDTFLSCYSCTVAFQFSHTAGASCQRTYCNEAPLEAKSVKTPASLQEHILTWIKYIMYGLFFFFLFFFKCPIIEFVSAKNRDTLQPFWQQAVGRSLCCRRCFNFPFHSFKIHSYKLL